jgi:hypothetical protein
MQPFGSGKTSALRLLATVMTARACANQCV